MTNLLASTAGWTLNGCTVIDGAWSIPIIGLYAAGPPGRATHSGALTVGDTVAGKVSYSYSNYTETGALYFVVACTVSGVNMTLFSQQICPPSGPAAGSGSFTLAVTIPAGASTLEMLIASATVPNSGSWDYTLPGGYALFGSAVVLAPRTVVFVYTTNRAGQIGAWSRYVFPFSIDAFAQLGNDLYIRNGDVVSKVVESAVSDGVGAGVVNFPGLVQWGWLDFGQAGVTKMMQGFDFVGSGAPSISVGFDQRNLAAFTAPYAIAPDTLPGGITPFGVAAPTLSIKLDFAGGSEWSVSQVLVYLSDMRGQP